MATQVLTQFIADAAVTTSKLALLGVDTSILADDAVTSAKIADLAVLEAALADNAVATAKIANAAVTSGKIANAAVGTAQLASAAVTQAKLASDSVGTAQLIDAAVTAAKVDVSDDFTWSGIHDFSSGKITVAAPVDAGDVTNKSYVDALISGADVKASVVCATDAAVDATRSGNVLTWTTTGAVSFDGVALDEVGMRVLVKDQPEAGDFAVDNGIYTVTTVGVPGVALVLTRASDADEIAEVSSGLFTFIEEGSTQAHTGWILTGAGSCQLNTSHLLFTQFSGAGSYSASGGLSLSGTVFSIADGGVSTAKLADAAVTAAKLADGSVETAKIADLAVTSGKIALEAVGENQLAPGSVVNSKIVDGAISTYKIAAYAVEEDRLANSSVIERVLADDAVATAKIQNWSVTTDKLADNSVTFDKLVDGSVITAKLGDNSVTSGKIADNAVGTSEIADGAVLTAKLGDNAVTAAKLGDNSVETAKIVDEAVTLGKLASAVASRLGGGWDVISKFTGDDSITDLNLSSGSVDLDEEALLVTQAGLVMEQGVDYTVSDNTGPAGVDQIIMSAAVPTGAKVIVRYRLA